MYKVASAILVLAIAMVSAPLQAASDKHQDSRTLAGRVLNSKEDPVPKAIVYLKNTKSQVVKTYITDDAGSYHFPGLSPVVDYEIYAEFNGARSATRTLSAFDNRQQVNLTLHIPSAK